MTEPTADPPEEEPAVPHHRSLDAGAKAPRFPTGRLLVTPGALLALTGAGVELVSLLSRHVRGDWGDLSAHDRKVNEDALRSGQRLLSAYALPDGATVWLITEADRSATTALLPEEY